MSTTFTLVAACSETNDLLNIQPWPQAVHELGGLRKLDDEIIDLGSIDFADLRTGSPDARGAGNGILEERLTRVRRGVLPSRAARHAAGTVLTPLAPEEYEAVRAARWG